MLSVLLGEAIGALKVSPAAYSLFRGSSSGMALFLTVRPLQDLFVTQCDPDELPGLVISSVMLHTYSGMNMASIRSIYCLVNLRLSSQKNTCSGLPWCG